METSQQLFNLAIKTFNLQHLNLEQLRRLKINCIQVIQENPIPTRIYEWLMLVKEKLPEIEQQHTVAEYF